MCTLFLFLIKSAVVCTRGIISSIFEEECAKHEKWLLKWILKLSYNVTEVSSHKETL
jgi:hypothetical protein